MGLENTLRSYTNGSYSLSNNNYNNNYNNKSNNFHLLSTYLFQALATGLNAFSLLLTKNISSNHHIRVNALFLISGKLRSGTVRLKGRGREQEWAQFHPRVPFLGLCD